MKIKFPFLLALLLFSMSAFAQTVEKDSIQVITIAQFEKMAQKKKAMVLDVRTPEEVAEGHLAGSVNINFLGDNFANEIQTLDKKKTYLLYCRSGSRTRRAADLMQKSGFKHVYMLEGGITAWNAAGKPTEK
ncbi:MAG: rhodanese-like domain-containing protein [Algoriphagus aquaeductus]|jgi:rhodanese-related sulfurtransferase|uniref:Rhodanese-related sulfurtransferase n=1 Tax=Algoriphagus aquaeductus TaxID=475299 RepID=A0A326RSL8_9BACT|nr:MULTISPECIES: rhodanese-like domain-containing protein [Algoriphagus]PZV84516.1 rhodanese-related sulfurtransferase [Algoriphagus aquaeductus]